jgi:glutamine cyclotransferase
MHALSEYMAVENGMGSDALVAYSIMQLTYMEKEILVYDAATFRLLGVAPYPHEGWCVA